MQLRLQLTMILTTLLFCQTIQSSPLDKAPNHDVIKHNLIEQRVSVENLAPKKHTVVDFLGRTVTVNNPAKRIVALAPHIVENLYSAGAGELIIGAVEHSDYPPAANKIKRVGAISAFSLEAIVELEPDLVVVWHSGHGGKVLNKLVQLNIPTYASDPRVLSDIPKAIRDFGILTNNSNLAEQNALSFEKKLHTLQKRYSQKKPISALYQVWNKPIQTLNDKHIISDVIKLCGGRNVFGSAPVLAPKISVESVLLENPQAIIASGMGEERPEWLEAWRQWSSIEAVQSNHLFFIPPDLIQRHTARILHGANLLCEQLDQVRNATP